MTALIALAIRVDIKVDSHLIWLWAGYRVSDHLVNKCQKSARNSEISQTKSALAAPWNVRDVRGRAER